MPLLTLDQIESLCADALKRAGAPRSEKGVAPIDIKNYRVQ